MNRLISPFKQKPLTQIDITLISVEKVFILPHFLSLQLLLIISCVSAKAGVWTGSWRGASSPRGHCRGAHEQGTETLTAWRADCVAAHHSAISPTNACPGAVCAGGCFGRMCMCAPNNKQSEVPRFKKVYKFLL